MTPKTILLGGLVAALAAFLFMAGAVAYDVQTSPNAQLDYGPPTPGFWSGAPPTATPLPVPSKYDLWANQMSRSWTPSIVFGAFLAGMMGTVIAMAGRRARVASRNAAASPSSGSSETRAMAADNPGSAGDVRMAVKGAAWGITGLIAGVLLLFIVVVLIFFVISAITGVGF